MKKNTTIPRRNNNDNNSKSRSPSKGRDKSKNQLKTRIKNIKGQKPSDWSKEELMDKLKKIANFNIDKLTGSGILEIINKRIMSEDLIVIKETLTRCKYFYFYYII